MTMICDMIGTLPSGVVYKAQVDLTPDVALQMRKMAQANPYKYTRTTWHNLYNEALDIIEKDGALENF